MATIYELAQMSSNVYDGTPSENPPTGTLLAKLNTSQWEVLTTSNADPGTNYWNQGYFGVAYYNTVTGDLVIANRGTDLVNGPATLFKNLFSDARLTLGGQLTVQNDAAAFAVYVLQTYSNKTINNFIETGHSLGGTEAQAAIANVVDNFGNLISSAKVSGVGFNSPGIGSYIFTGAASSYSFANIVTQGDAVNYAGDTHLGSGTVTLAAGPDTSQLEPETPANIPVIPTDGMPAYGTYLFDVLLPAHEISTILAWLGAGDPDPATGTYNWTSTSTASDIPGGISVNGSLPSYSFNANGNLVITDPSSGIVATLSLSADGNSLVGTFSGGGSAFAQALSSLGTLTVPLSELGESLGGLEGAPSITESISRNQNGSFDLSFAGGGGAAQFVATASDPSSAFDYALPGSGQTLVEAIDNGADSPSGSISVLTGSTTTQLTGGKAVAGQTVTWTDGSHDQYQWAGPASSASTGRRPLTTSIAR